MKPGISHLIAGKMPYEEFFPKARAAGYECVELNMSRDGELTGATSEDDLKRILGLARKHELPIVSVCHNHCTGNLLDSGEAQETSVKETERGLRVAKALGASCTLHTLGRLRAELFYDDAYRNGVEALRKLAPTAEDLEVSIAVEFVWNGFLFSPLEMKRFLDDVGSPYVGFYFDPGNMAVFQFPQHWARVLGRQIKMVHMKDWKGGALNGGWPALLAGAVDFAAVNRELRAGGYDGPMISEVGESQAPWDETAKAIRKIIEM
jgi:hexulose-6-phosphate isomerase